MICAWKVPVRDGGVIEDILMRTAITNRIPECTLEHLNAVWVAEELTGVSLTERMNAAEELVTAADKDELLDKIVGQVGDKSYLRALTTGSRRGRRYRWAATHDSKEPDRDYVLEFKAPVYKVESELASTYSYGADSAKYHEWERAVAALVKCTQPTGAIYLTARIRRPIPKGYVQANIGLEYVRLYYNPGRSRALVSGHERRVKRAVQLAQLCEIVPEIIKDMYALFDGVQPLNAVYKKEYDYLCNDKRDLRLSLLDSVKSFDWLAKRMGKAHAFRRVLKRSLLRMRPLVPELRTWFGDIEYEHLVGEARRVRRYLLAQYKCYYPVRCRKEIELLTCSPVELKERKQ